MAIILYEMYGFRCFNFSRIWYMIKCVFLKLSTYLFIFRKNLIVCNSIVQILREEYMSFSIMYVFFNTFCSQVFWKYIALVNNIHRVILEFF